MSSFSNERTQKNNRTLTGYGAANPKRFESDAVRDLFFELESADVKSRNQGVRTLSTNSSSKTVNRTLDSNCMKTVFSYQE